MVKYYIYHIPTFKHKDGSIGKIGCTTDVLHRVSVEQNYTEYQILEEHTDIMIASNREIELQKQYGYPVDNVPYYKSYEWCVSGSSNGGKAVHKKHPDLAIKLGSKNGRENGIKSRHKVRKPVYQYDLQGNLIKVFEGIRIAGKELGYCIGANVRGRTKTCYGYIFTYKKRE